MSEQTKTGGLALTVQQRDELRDHFAGEALPAVIGKYELLTAVGSDPVPATPSAAAQLAYEYADAMLKARE